MKLTLSVIKADIGGYVGHSSVDPDLINTARERNERARNDGTLVDYLAIRVGDDVQIIMSHQLEKQKDQNTFDDPGVNSTRWLANGLSKTLPPSGPFVPHRFRLDEMVYTTCVRVMSEVEVRFSEAP